MALQNFDCELRPLASTDIKAVTELTVSCTGCERDVEEAMFTRAVTGTGSKGIHLVAIVRGQLIGWSRASLFEAPSDAPSNVAPNGWYLLGLAVHPEFRRRGVGAALTDARLGWISERSAMAWYFTDETNEASIRLHRSRGFRYVASNFWFPGTNFHRGSGTLFVRDNLSIDGRNT